MSLYQCEKCGCIENSALGWYWSRKYAGPENDLKLCSACAPRKFDDGTDTRFDGTWHEQFEIKFYPLGTMETDQYGNIREKK